MHRRVWLLGVGLAFLGNAGMGETPTLAPPAAVTDLRAQALSDSAVVLTWTEVNSGLTSIAKYVVRFGVFESFVWSAASDVKTGGCGAPVYGSTAAGGRTRSCVLSGLIPHRAYRFQVVAYTGSLNFNAVYGPLSNIAEATTAQRVGPILVWRPRMFLDSVSVAAASLSDFGPMRYPLNGLFSLGDREARFYDSTGALVGLGYVLVTRP